MAYRKIDFEYSLNDLHNQLKGLDYLRYIDVKNEFLNRARSAGYQEKRLQQFWQRVCLKLDKVYGFKKPLSLEWKNVRMRLYRQSGSTRL
jgi:hypothetical protein